MDYLSGHVLTLANSIIGVSVLAMPYCFKQCGIVLSIIILLISSIISRLACHFLLKSAILARRKTFEILAFHIFGSLGKLIIELGIIGFLLGNCIAFFVVMGDLAPEIISEMSGTHPGNTLRNGVLITMALFFVLPLGLLRNVTSLMGVSKATVAFYFCLVLKIVLQAVPDLLKGDWINEVELWRPAGILQCLPIFSMALFCQTQIFEIYETLPNASLEKMNGLIRVAVNICTCVYILVGTFGYISYCKLPFTGNILSSFVPSIMTDVMKIGFILSLAFSFPVVIFPCRASLYSLLFKEGYTFLHDSIPVNYIPEGKFRLLTVVIVAVSLTFGILIPNVELVLGLVGSTIGVMICVLFPVTCFICISPKNTNERILAQLMLTVGVIVMVLGTYANLYAFEEVQLEKMETVVDLNEKRFEKMSKHSLHDIVIDIAPTTMKLVKDPEKKSVGEKLVEPPPVMIMNEEKQNEVRHEPPQPEEPAEIHVKPVEIQPQIKPVIEEATPPPKDVLQDLNLVESKNNDIKAVPVVVEVKETAKKSEEIAKEAIQKEDEAELKEQEKPNVDPNRVLIDTIQKKQEEFQEKLVEQQKKLDQVLEQGDKKNDVAQVNEAKLKAVKSIETIAKRAIEKISEQGNEETENKNKLEENKTNKNNSAQIQMKPLPLIKAQSINDTAETVQQSKVVEKIDESNKKTEEELQKDETRRKKRAVSAEENLQKLGKVVKQACEELSSQTEKPTVRMLCKLSEPALPKIDLKAALQNENSYKQLKPGS